MRVVAKLELALWAQRGRLLLWAPVFLAMGIGLYFSLAEEPAAKEIAVVIVIAVFVVIAARAAMTTKTAITITTAISLAAGSSAKEK